MLVSPLVLAMAPELICVSIEDIVAGLAPTNTFLVFVPFANS
jgi:hypothetical protein